MCLTGQPRHVKISYITLLFTGDFTFCVTKERLSRNADKILQPLDRSIRQSGKNKEEKKWGGAGTYLETDGRARGGRERSSRVSISRVGGPPPPSRPGRDPLAVRLGPELNV